MLLYETYVPTCSNRHCLTFDRPAFLQNSRQLSFAAAAITDRTAALVFLAASKRNSKGDAAAALAEEDALHWEHAAIAKPAAALLTSSTPEAISAFASAATEAASRASNFPLLGAVLAADVSPLLADAKLGPALAAAAPSLAPAVASVTGAPWWKEAVASASPSKPAAATASKKGKAADGAAAAPAADGSVAAPISKAQQKAAAAAAKKAEKPVAVAGASLLTIAELPCPVPDLVSVASVTSEAGDASLAIPLAHTLSDVFGRAVQAAFPAAAEGAFDLALRAAACCCFAVVYTLLVLPLLYGCLKNCSDV